MKATSETDIDETEEALTKKKEKSFENLCRTIHQTWKNNYGKFDEANFSLRYKELSKLKYFDDFDLSEKKRHRLSINYISAALHTFFFHSYVR